MHVNMDLVVSINAGTPIQTPEFCNTYYWHPHQEVPIVGPGVLV